jgi:hypothetical protein
MLGLLVLLAAGCDRRDPYRTALETSQALVSQGKTPGDPAFDQVLRELEKVPVTAQEHAQAQSLKERLTHARAPKLERPLVTPFQGSADEPELATQRAQCEALARQLGTAPAQARQALQSKLATCRAQQQEIESLRHSRQHAH